jgi:hypothetical protein
VLIVAPTRLRHLSYRSRTGKSLQVLANPPAGEDQANWNQWFDALLFVSLPMTPNGASPALEWFLLRSDCRRAAPRAPADVRDKVEYLSRVGQRDIDASASRAQHCSPDLQRANPAFHNYVLAVTIAACLTLRHRTPLQTGHLPARYDGGFQPDARSAACASGAAR